MGSEPGNFREPHDIYMGGSKGYVYVADRQNNRIQVFDQDGKFIAAWKQFGQPSSVYVDKDDNIFVGSVYLNPKGGARGEGPTTGENDRGIVVANAISGELKYFIPDPGDLSKMTDTGTSASGICRRCAGKHLCRGRWRKQFQKIRKSPVKDMDLTAADQAELASVMRN